jgi:hypothetical protein
MWSGSRKNADTKNYTKQQSRYIVRVDSAWRRSVRLRSKNAPFEKSFNLTKLSGDHGGEFLLMWSDFKCRIDEETPLTFPIIDRVIYYLGKELMDRLFGGQRRLQPTHPVTRVAIQIPLKGAHEQTLLVTEGVIKARRRHSHRCREIAHRSGLIAALPKTTHRRMHGGGLIEFSWSGHSDPL